MESQDTQNPQDIIQLFRSFAIGELDAVSSRYNALTLEQQRELRRIASAFHALLCVLHAPLQIRTLPPDVAWVYGSLFAHDSNIAADCMLDYGATFIPGEHAGQPVWAVFDEHGIDYVKERAV